MIIRIRAALLLLAALGFSQSAWAILISGGAFDGTNVGGVDAFIAEGPQQGNPTGETAWVNGILGSGTVTFQIKDDPVTYYATNVADVFAFALSGATAEYYLIKNATRIALFQNLASLGWGVFDASLLSDTMNLPDTERYSISHVTRFDGPTVNVPEPGTLPLLSAGLLALALLRRRARIA